MDEGTKRASTTALAVLSAVAAAGSERDPDVRIDDPIAPLVNASMLPSRA
jgi:hypothetical protein